MLRSFFAVVGFAAFALALSSCASGVGIAPPGGPPDTTAPRVVAATPPNGTLNFRGDEVTVEFSEYMSEAQTASNVVITPIPSRTPDFDWSGRQLTIAFQEPLLADRTYAITFAAGLSDLGSPANRLGQPFTIRFSTGDVIDSGVVRGNVIGVNRRRAFVFAYRMHPGSPDTLRPDHTRPDFIAPIADDGTFALEALPPGTLRLIAVTDDFGDQLYSPGADAYGISPRDVTIDSSYAAVSGITIRLAPAPVDLISPALYSARSLDRTSSELRFNEPIDTMSLSLANVAIESGGTLVGIRSLWRSTTNWLAVVVAHEPIAGTDATVRVHDLRDTAGNVIADSVASETFTVTSEFDTTAPMLTHVGVDSVHAYSFPDSISIDFNEAVVGGSLSGAVTLRDTAGHSLRFGLRRISPASFIAWPADTLASTTRATLEINLALFSDLAGNRRDSIVKLRVPVGAIRQTGTISGTLIDSIAPNTPHIIIARLSGTSRSFTRTVRSGSWEFTDVPEGEYHISAFRDDNSNARFDFGSITPHQGPETLIEWQVPVRVRPRWATSKVDLVF